MREMAEIPETHRKQGIRWLILEKDTADTGGVFLYLHKSLHEVSEYDSWHESVDLAKTEAAHESGVDDADWSVDLKGQA
jgi:hypothetical protein